MAARPDSRRDRGADATNVLTPSSSLVGRETELEELVAALSDGRLVTIVGAPGVGKTRLAREVAASKREARGGVWQVDLVAAADVADVCSAVEAALAAPAGARATREARVAALGKAIAARGPSILLMDGFERAAPFAAQTIGAWRDAAPAARFLVTSRRPLRLAAERMLAIGPLSSAKAAELFVERARAQGASLGDDPDSRALVDDIVRRLDGLPLAIELAAARVRGLSLRALADALAHGIEVLAIGLADAPPRHASLALAIEASWSLLTAPERRAAARLAFFATEFSLESAAFLLDLEDAARAPASVDLLGALTDASLVHTERRGGEATFRMLAGIRAFAHARLGAGDDREAASRRHAELVARDALTWSAAGLETPTPARAIGDLAAAFEATLATAPGGRRTEHLLAMAVCLDDAFGRAGRGGERTTYLDRAIDVAARERAEDARLAMALLRRARGNLALGRGAEARVDRQRAAAIPAAQQDPRVRAALVSAAAEEAFRDGQLETAHGLFEEALATHRALGDRGAEARARLELARIAFAEGSLERARDFVGRARALATALGEPSLSAASMLADAQLTHEAGGDADCGALFERALAAAESAGDVATAFASTLALARVRIEQLRIDDARALLERALTLRPVAAHRRDEAIARARLGLCDEIDGRLADAAAIYEDAIAAHAEAEDLAAEGTVRLWLARVEAARGEAARAHGSLDEGRRRVHASGAAPLLPLCDLCEASVELAASRAWSGGALDASRDRARRALDAASRPLDGRALAADARIAAAMLARALGDAPASAAAATSVAPDDALVVARSARRFRLPRGEAVSLSTSRSLRLILERLTDARENEPGTALAPEALLAAGWPGERVLHDAGASRVYAAVAQLRRKGLRDVLLRRDDGYLLDPRVAVVRAEDVEPRGG